MPSTRCRRCDAEQDEGMRFCTQCGYELGEAGAPEEDPAPGTADPPRPSQVDVRLIACPLCGATNAESRQFCGRCRADLHDPEAPRFQPVEQAAADPGPWTGDAAPAEPDRGTPAVFVVAVTLAGLALGGVLLTILSARGVGLFAGPEEPEGPPEPTAHEVTAVRASSELPPSGDVTYAAENVLDGDAETAWSEGASGGGTGEWIELELARGAEVSRLVVWNGYQKGEHFADNARVARVRVELGDRRFDADLLDVRGPQAVDLPQVVETDRVRLTVMSVHEGRRYSDVAISGIEVRGPPPDER